MGFVSDSMRSIDTHLALPQTITMENHDARRRGLKPQPWTASPDQVLHANLLSIFCLGDPTGMLEAIWHKMPVIYEEHGASAGRDAVLRAAERFRMAIGTAPCEPVGPVIGHSGLYMLRWQAYHPGAYVASGCHLANLRDGRIDSLYSVID